jgi:multidrug efflux pump subunit AcrA (membrane-fusion protein)
MKLSCSWFSIIAVSVAVTAPGCHRAPAEAESESAPATPVQVRVATASIRTLRPSIGVIGTVIPIPERTAEVSTQSEGNVKRVAVVEGQAVKAGDLLIQLDDRLATAKLASVRAIEQRAAAVLEKLRNGPRSQELEAAQQEALQLAAVARSLRAKLDALRPLHDKGDVSDVEYGQAKARLDAASAESAAADARVKLLEAGSRQEDIVVAAAELAAAQADLTAARLAVEFCQVTAPIDGVVVNLSVRAGATVSSTDILAELINTSELFVKTRIPSARLQQVHSGAAAEVRIGQEDGDAIHGKIVRLSPLADAASGDVDAFIAVPNPDDALRPGLACRVRIWLPQLAAVLVVPAAALADRDGSPVVTVVRDNRAYEVEITLGVVTSQHVQITGGLDEGALVAVEGGYALPAGCPVEAVADATEDGGA